MRMPVGTELRAEGILRAMGHTRNTIRCAKSVNTPLWQAALAQAIEARRVETHSGSIEDESAVAESDVPIASQSSSSGGHNAG